LSIWVHMCATTTGLLIEILSKVRDD
jgi:hypothetical protein